MVVDFVKLGYRLEKTFLRPRFEAVLSEFNELAASVLNNNDANPNVGFVSHGLGKGQKTSMRKVPVLFEMWECHLLTVHTLLSILIGGSGGQLPCLDNPSQRLLVFRTIVEAEKSVSQTVNGDIDVVRRMPPRSRRSRKEGILAECNNADQWPLLLPAVQCSSITPMIITSSRPTDNGSFDRQLEQVIDMQYLCTSFLNSFEAMVEDSSQLQKEPSGMILLDDNILLSLRDARRFSLAMSRLPQVSQLSILSRLVGIVHKGFHTGTFDVENNEMSHLFARGITLCIGAVDVASSPALASLLAEEMNASLCFSVPRFVRNQHHSAAAESNQIDTVQFSKDIYQSIFSNWQSPAVPANTEGTSILDDNSAELLKSTIVQALALGFETSITDGCHLLFSSWNAASRLHISWEGSAASTVVKSSCASGRILRLREDMCELHQLLQESLEKREPSHLNATLYSGIGFAEESLLVLAFELDKIAPTSTTTEIVAPTCAIFAYYEALPLYISFLISMHCCPGSNDMGLAHRLQKSVPSLSSTQGSRFLRQQFTSHLEEESVSEANDASINDGVNKLRMNALTCLHKACLAHGAAPCYPDWLDTSCKLRQLITPSNASDSANRALLSLTRFGINIWRSYIEAMEKVLGILDETGDVNMSDSEGAQTTTAYSVALHFFFAQQRHPTELSDVFYSKVASLCQTSSSLFKLLVLSLTSQSRLTGGELVTTSAQRILGANYVKPRKVFKGEHRANGMWETLLAEALQGSSLTVPSHTISKALGIGDDSKLTKLTLQRIASSLQLVLHWRRVLHSVLDAMVPAAALLRFSTHGGKGQDRRTSSCEGLSNVALLHNQKFATTTKLALSFLSFVAACSSNDDDVRLTSRAAAGSLLATPSHFTDLMALWSVINSFNVMSRGLRIMEDKEGTWSRLQKESSCAMIRSTMKQFSDNAGGEEDEFDWSHGHLNGDKIAAVQACMGVTKSKEGKMIGIDMDTDLMEILAENIEIGLTHRAPISLPSSKETIVSARFSAEFPLSLLLNILCGKLPLLRGTMQIFVAEMLIQLMCVKCDVIGKKGKKTGGGTVNDIEAMRATAASSLDEFSNEDIKSLVGNFSINVADPTDELVLLSRKTAVIVGLLGCVLHKGRSDSGCKIIHDKLLSSLDSWAGSSKHRHLIQLLFLLATRFGTLHDAGRSIIRLLKARNKGGDAVPQQNVSTLQDFLQFVSSLDRLVNRKSSSVTQLVDTTLSRHDLTFQQVDDTTVTLKSGTVVPRTCSFVETGEGFTEQHWYNCYTCGLIWEKVCAE